MWTAKAYKSIFKWMDKGQRAAIRAQLQADGLEDIITRLDNAKNMGDWYTVVQEAREAVGADVVEASANQAEKELNAAAAALGRKGGQAKTAAKAAASRENGKKGGRPKKQGATGDPAGESNMSADSVIEPF